MAARDWIVAMAVGLGGMMAAGVVVAGPAVQPPPAKEFKNGRWQVQVQVRDEDRQAYWFAAGMGLVFGAGLGSIAVGRFLGRAWPAAGFGGGIGTAVGVVIVLVLGPPDGAPAVVALAMVLGYMTVGAVSGWQAAQSRMVKPAAVTPTVPVGGP